MKYGYCRVSTIKQAMKGNSLEDQERLLQDAGAQEIVFDNYTGATVNRPNFTNLLNKLQEGDTLIVTKLDRFARTSLEGGATIQMLQNKGVAIHILNMGMIDNSPTGKLIATIFLAFAEFERDMIVERTQTGKALAREKGVRVDGRPLKYSGAQVEHAIDLLKDHSYTQVANMTGISKSTLIRANQRRKEQV